MLGTAAKALAQARRHKDCREGGYLPTRSSLDFVNPRLTVLPFCPKPILKVWAGTALFFFVGTGFFGCKKIR